MKVSVIVPFVGEYPQVIWTIKSIQNDLRDRVDFEIIAVDNYCKEVVAQKKGAEFKNLSGEYLANAANHNKEWLKYEPYPKALSHWQAKQAGIRMATGDIYCFIDAHCVVSRNALYQAIKRYERFMGDWGTEASTMHLPLTYQIMDPKRLIYSMDCQLDLGHLSYKFSSYDENRYIGHDVSHYYDQELFEVPCMSTCGMMIHKDLYHSFGGWPESLGIYGGGENFINYVLSILGKKKLVSKGDPLCHHGAKRDYHWNYTDHLRNRGLASYMVGGEGLLDRLINAAGGRPEVKEVIRDDIIEHSIEQRGLIASKQVISISNWVNNWRD